MKDSGRPRAREDALVVREIDDEVLIYDLERHEAHCLNTSAAAVWKACDGKKTPAEIATELRLELDPGIDEDVVWVALAELWKQNLLQGEKEPEPGASTGDAGLSRASLLRKVGVGAAALSLPAVTSLVAPTAALAVSNLAAGACCNASSECASLLCSATAGPGPGGPGGPACVASGSLGACA